MIIEFWKTNENSITCYKSRPNKEEAILKIPKKRQKNLKQPITIESPTGVKEDFPSVAAASDAIKMNVNTMYAFLNGRAKNPTEYKIYKSTLNN